MFGTGRDQQNVVSMMTRENARRSAPLREVESYWQALCAPDAVPMRSQIDPRGIEGALENAFLAERIAPGMARIRVAGSHLLDLMGMEVAGMPLSCLFPPESRARLSEHVTRVFDQPAILRADLRAEDGFGKPKMEGQLLLLPLRSDMGDVSRALGCLVSHGRIGRVPRRFVIGDIAVTPALPAQDSGDTGHLPGSPAPDAAKPKPRIPRHQFNEPPAIFVHGDPSRQRPKLRIIVSNDD